MWGARITSTGVRIDGLHHSAIALLGAPVGGTTELLVESPDSSPLAAEGSAISDSDYAAASVGVAAGILTLVAVGWYAGRRWLA